MTYYTYNFVKNYLARYRRLEDERDRLRGISKEQQMALDISTNAVKQIEGELASMDRVLKRMANLGNPLIPQYQSALSEKDHDAWTTEITEAIIKDLTIRLNAKGPWAVSENAWREVTDEYLKNLP